MPFTLVSRLVLITLLVVLSFRSPLVGQESTGEAEGESTEIQATSQADLELQNQRKPTKTPTRLWIESKLHSMVTFSIDSSMADLGTAIGSQTSLPVIVDKLSLGSVGIDLATRVAISLPEQPICSSLRMLLDPHGLKAVVQDDAIVIQADMAYWTRKGVSTDVWLDPDGAFYDRIQVALDKKVGFDFDKTSLADALDQIAKVVDISILIDARGLDDIGLTDEHTVTINLKDVRLRSFLRLMLRDLDLTYHIDNEVLLITSLDAAWENPKNRIYFLEGTGIVEGDFDSVIMWIRCFINPETWDISGGPSTITILRYGKGNRPAIVVSQTTDVHEQIETLMTILRRTHSGRNPGNEAGVKIPESFQIPGSVNGSRLMNGMGLGGDRWDNAAGN